MPVPPALLWRGRHRLLWHGKTQALWCARSDAPVLWCARSDAMYCDVREVMLLYCDVREVMLLPCDVWEVMLSSFGSWHKTSLLNLAIRVFRCNDYPITPSMHQELCFADSSSLSLNRISLQNLTAAALYWSIHPYGLHVWCMIASKNYMYAMFSCLFDEG